LQQFTLATLCFGRLLASIAHNLLQDRGHGEILMFKSATLIATIAFGIVLGVAAFAKDDKDAELARPKAFDDVVACKAIEDAAQRLACYDEKVAALDAAQKSGDIVATDKAAVKEAKRGLFGFDIPKIKIFGGDDVQEIEAAVKSVNANRAGILTIVLEDGARWQQVDTKVLNREPRIGSKARIRVASMGSYLVTFDGGPAIRMKRVN
jgi:hypothetical protein